MKELAFYMRGWKIDSDETKLPLRATQTNYQPRFQSQVEINVSTCSIQLFDILNQLTESIREKILFLPLVMFNKSNSFKIFGSSINKTIRIEHNKKLIEFIRNIKNTNDQNSCIRTGSNWILISSIYYAELCGFKNSVSINEIDDIR